ncbi:NACHT domain-containing protein [Saccharothrix sp. Mg75]|uniref:NACHT domain-containing protein n=1 Tax=Saccharothrix sp. Mg75 TaxID=3445357 RepID=UPI003EEA6414
MRSPGPRVRTRIVLVLGVVSFCALLVWITLRVAAGDVDSNDKLAGVVSMYVAMVGLPVAAVALALTARQGTRAGPIGELDEWLDGMADVLATSVRGQLEAEERIRQVHDPFPLPVRWTNADERLTDHWENVHGSPDRPEPVRLDGHGDRIVEVFDAVPSRRLVVLGEAGAGKTVLASRFVLVRLARRRRAADGPVPVVFSLGSWDPTTVPLRTWLVEQLLTDHPVLAARDGSGTTAAASLLATGRVMPVLDGFDEISEHLRAHAITAVNAGLGRHDPLLLTSRDGEYARAVGTGDVLTAAAVVELASLDVEDLARYLPLSTRKSGKGEFRTKWDPVLERLRDHRGDPAGEALLRTLGNPLMVALARSAYSDTTADPLLLLGFRPSTPGVDAYRRVVEDHLFVEFFPAAYSRGTPGDDETRSSRLGDVQRWLHFLARHLDDLGTRDFAWWQLVSAVPAAVRALAAALVISASGFACIGALGWLGDWEPGARRLWWLCGLSFTAVSALAAALIIGPGRGPRVPPAPSRLRLRFPRSVDDVLASFADGLQGCRAVIWLAVFTVGGVIFGLAGTVFLGLDGGVVVGVIAAVVIGVAIRFLIGFVRTLSVPVDPARTVNPPGLLRIDRRTAVSHGVLVGAGSALVIGLGFLSTIGVLYGLVSGAAGWIAFALASVVGASAVWIFFFTVWGPWVLARTWLPLRGRLPWRVMTFLADAHARGVLRQVGGVYQFRHARLQDHLAGTTR